MNRKELTLNLSRPEGADISESAAQLYVSRTGQRCRKLPIPIYSRFASVLSPVYDSTTSNQVNWWWNVSFEYRSIDNLSGYLLNLWIVVCGPWVSYLVPIVLQSMYRYLGWCRHLHVHQVALDTVSLASPFKVVIAWPFVLASDWPFARLNDLRVFSCLAVLFFDIRRCYSPNDLINIRLAVQGSLGRTVEDNLPTRRFSIMFGAEMGGMFSFCFLFLVSLFPTLAVKRDNDRPTCHFAT